MPDSSHRMMRSGSASRSGAWTRSFGRTRDTARSGVNGYGVIMPHPTSIRFDKATVDRLDEIAAATGSTRAAVIRDAVAQFLDRDARFCRMVQQGLDAVREGRVVSHADAKARMRALGITLK
ncbi:ribbon-helix-helix protein, CopG family [Desulfovibrio oxamicus]|uniref:Ribbon-helix-helix protein, CopG family n=2 Tax=Nitratidesulfovibrio oxamicus TaxID=32016 RepID=A0ABS0J2R2_9BACT|nr:ribbon-helix-helix protein, CopG family [Nitratidesulfovibrio oxamicus]